MKIMKGGSQYGTGGHLATGGQLSWPHLGGGGGPGLNDKVPGP